MEYLSDKEGQQKKQLSINVDITIEIDNNDNS